MHTMSDNKIEHGLIGVLTIKNAHELVVSRTEESELSHHLLQEGRYKRNDAAIFRAVCLECLTGWGMTCRDEIWMSGF